MKDGGESHAALSSLHRPKSYVKRSGRATEAQKKSYDSLLEKYSIPFSAGMIAIPNLTVEIGFGSGYACALIAQANPDKNYLGIEVHTPGIGRLLWEIENRRLSNVKIIEYDAVCVFEKMIAEDSLDAVHIFFPDPWPKKRHRKRRLVQRPFTEILAKSLKKTGYIYMATDWEDYALHALEELEASPVLQNTFEGFAQPQSWRPPTKFEKKGIAKDHLIRELFFRRI